MIRRRHVGAMVRAALDAALLATACWAAGACGGENTITQAWRTVDSCLEQHPSFVGNVVVGKGGPGDAIDSLSIEGSGGAFANAYRFPSAADARSAEQGLGPPGPTVTFYGNGNIALEVNASTSQGTAGAVEQCFDSAYGNPSLNTATAATTTGALATTTSTKTVTSASPTTTVYQQTGPLPTTGTRSCDGTVFAGLGTECSLAQDVFTAYLDALNKSAAQTGTPTIPPKITAIGGTTPLITVQCSEDEAGTVSCTGPRSFVARFKQPPPNTLGPGGTLEPGQRCAPDAVATQFGQSAICVLP
jgi:hypothetical protein